MKKFLIIALISNAIIFGLTAQAVVSVDDNNQGDVEVNEGILTEKKASAPNPVEIYFFKATGCPHCASLESYLNSLQAEFPTLTVKKFDLRAEPQSIALYQKLADAVNGSIDSVPATFIGNEMIIGDRQGEVRQKIELCVSLGCPSPVDNLAANSVHVNSENTTSSQNYVGFIILIILVIVIFGFIIFNIIVKRK